MTSMSPMSVFASDTTQRVCGRCFEKHPETFYNRDRTKPDGLYPYCKNCSRAACKKVYRKYHDKHVAAKRAWKDENRDLHHKINKEYRANNPEAIRLGSQRYRARLKTATPSWVDRSVLKAFAAACPQGFHVDHIIPLAGKNVCGLNVIWNLQYLPAEDHWLKGTSVPDSWRMEKSATR